MPPHATANQTERTLGDRLHQDFILPFLFGLGYWLVGIIFCEVTLALANVKSWLVNNLPFCKVYSSRQTCLICHIRTSESRKLFPTHSRKALKKGK